MDENCRFWDDMFCVSLALFAAVVVGFTVGVLIIVLT